MIGPKDATDTLCVPAPPIWPEMGSLFKNAPEYMVIFEGVDRGLAMKLYAPDMRVK